MLTDKTQSEIQTLMSVALGKQPADLVIRDANLVNVYSGEMIKNQSVAIVDRWIACVGSNLETMIGPDTELIDADGQTLIPGLIDGHTHVAWLYSAHEFARQVATGGTTLVVTEALEPYPVAGCEGVIDFLESLKDQPIKFLATAPAMVSVSSTARGISDRDLTTLLKRADIIGLGESYWQEVLKYPPPIYRQWQKPCKTVNCWRATLPGLEATNSAPILPRESVPATSLSTLSRFLRACASACIS